MSALRSTLVQAIRHAFGSLIRSPVRSLILLQGVLWATVLGVLPPAIIRGSREAAIARAHELGSDRVVVYEAPGETRRLDWGTAAAIRGFAWPQIQSVSAYGKASGLVAVDGEQAGRASRRIVDGRWFTPEELASGDPVALVPVAVAKARFGVESAIGRKIPSPQGPGDELTIVGTFEIHDERASTLDDFGYRREHVFRGLMAQILEYSGVYPREFDWVREASRIVVPATAHPEVAAGVFELSVRPDAVGDTVRELKKELVRRGVRPVVLSNVMVQIIFSETFEMLSRLHVLLFAIGVLAGVIVVANTNILSMLERKREIAIRRVEGATRNLIALQFVVETGTTCLLGSLLGIPLALALAWFRTALDPSDSLRWIVPVPEIFQTVCAISVFGILGGLLPAVKAARVEPVEVLSHE